jgi:hypothetical protein
LIGLLGAQAGPRSRQTKRLDPDTTSPAARLSPKYVAYVALDSTKPLISLAMAPLVRERSTVQSCAAAPSKGPLKSRLLAVSRTQLCCVLECDKVRTNAGTCPCGGTLVTHEIAFRSLASRGAEAELLRQVHSSPRHHCVSAGSPCRWHRVGAGIVGLFAFAGWFRRRIR